MLFKFAIRNILRNKKRTILTATSILFAAWIAAISIGWGKGVLGTMVKSYIKFQTSNIKISTDEYNRRERFLPVDEIVYESKDLINKIKNIKEVEHVEERIKFGIMLANNNLTVTSIGMGIDLLNNKLNLEKKIIKGEVTDSGIYIGDKLAKKLDVSKGESLLLAAKTSEGGLNGIKLKINGIFRFNMSLFDRKFFFLNTSDAKKLLKIYEGTTELYVFTKNIEDTDKVQEKIKKILPKGLVALNYKEQMGGMYDTLRQRIYMMYFFVVLILFLASFVIINTMMMSIFERLREIGTIKALGMRNRELFLNFTLEGGIIGLLGSIPGAIFGYITLMYFYKKGLDLSKSFKGIDMPIEYIIRPEPSFMVLIISIVLSCLITSLSAMIPAKYAMNLMPAEALRKI